MVFFLEMLHQNLSDPPEVLRFFVVQIHCAAGDHDGREPNHEAQDLSDQLMMIYDDLVCCTGDIYLYIPMCVCVYDIVIYVY